jgi:hypothetical protein
VAAQSADRGLGQPVLEQRAADGELLRGEASRPIIALIVCVGAVAHGTVPLFPGDPGEDPEQFLFTVIASVRRVRGEPGDLQLVRLDKTVGDAPRTGEP